MPKKKSIVRYTTKQLDKMPSQTDWAKVDAITQEEILAQAKEDGTLLEGWEKLVIPGLPPGKEAVKLRIDRDVLRWYRATGKGYQTRMNQVLRTYAAAHKGGDGHAPL